MKNSIAAIVLATLVSTSVAEAAISSVSSSTQGINSAPIENIISTADANLVPLVMDLGFAKTVAPSPEAAPMLVTWSIKGAAKKVGRGAKKIGRGAKKAGRGIKLVGKEAGRGLRRANRVIVPSEIRNAASKAKRAAIRAGRYVAKHPYGKRCKPNKFLQPVCTVKAKRTSVVRDHRSNKRVSHDHRTN